MTPKSELTENAKEVTEPVVPKPVAQEEQRFDFCPHKDLNLPTSYEEVVQRFNRLQGDRAWELMN